MSEMSKKARADMRAKANRLGSSKSPEKVDASSWTPGSPLNADRKTGARPVRARAYKFGGKIQGDRGPVNAGRKPRASGGKVSDDNAKLAVRLGGDRKALNVPSDYGKPKVKPKEGRKDGGKVADNEAPKSGGSLNVHNTVGENKKELGSYHEGGYKKGGRAEKCGGGGMKKGGRAERAKGGSLTPNQRAIAAKVKEDTRPKDDDQKTLRDARKSGGRAKGKTNINIVIGSPNGADKPPPLMPQMPVRPPVAPPPPPPGPPPGGLPPMAGPPPGGPPPMGPGMNPPMMRRSGGRTVHMTAGAGSGEGRLEKTAHAKAAR